MGHTERVVILIDMDCFYCQVEEKLNPNLKNKPIAVVQYNAWRGGGIIAVNYPARDEGVTRHMRGNEAKQKCPSINLVQVPEVRGKADLTKYRDAGKEVADVLATFTPLLQRASVDEAYLDITEQVEKKIATDLNDLNVDNLANTFVVGSDLKDFIHNVTMNREFTTDNLKLAVGALICEEIRSEVFKKTGYKCSAGIAHNKILAKLVCSHHKPNKQTVLPQDAVENLFETIPINKITSLGGKFGQTLADDFQIKFVGQLAKIPEKMLKNKYDEKTAKWLYNIAKGIDTEPVTTKLISKSIACCKNFSGGTALKTSENVEYWLQKLSEELAERLEKDFNENNRRAKQVIISFTQNVNKADVHSSRTQTLLSYEPKKICQTAVDVIKKNCSRNDGSYHVKFLGLSAGHFKDVKKVREITSFFQVAQNKNTVQNNTIDVVSEISNDDNISNDNETAEQNIYAQLTQELHENPEELIYYDDSYRVKCCDPLQPINDHKPLSCIENITYNIENKSHTVFDPDQPSSSFFNNYFVDDDVSVLNISTDKDTKLQEKETSEQSCSLNVEEQSSELCNECQKMIPVTELMSHQDYHFALKLSENENISQKSDVKPVTSQKKDKSKGMKRKISNNGTLIGFFKKDQEETNDITETCTECNKKIRIDDLSSHMDYHIAKKIHLEINAIKPVNLKLVQTKHKLKGQSSNKSVTSFFKPL